MCGSTDGKNVTVIVDSREQRPWTFGNEMPTVRKKLDLGDYSVHGHELEIAVERKSLDDFVHSVTQERRRFFEELDAIARLRKWSAVIVEGSIREIYGGKYSSKAQPGAVLATVAAIEVGYGIPVYLEPDRACAVRRASWLLMGWAKRSCKARAASGVVEVGKAAGS